MALSTHTRLTLTGQAGLDRADGFITADDPARFSLVRDRWSFDDVMISSGCMTPSQIRSSCRSPATFWPGPEPVVSVVFVTVGDFQATHEHRNLRFIIGSAAYVTDWNLLDVSTHVPSSVVVVTVPRESLQTRDALPSGIFGALGFTATLGSPLLAFAEALLATVDTTPMRPELTASVLLELVAQLFTDDRGSTNTTVSPLTQSG